LQKSNRSSANFGFGHETSAYAVSALIGTHPKTFDLTEQQRRLTDRTNTDAANWVAVDARDEKETVRGHQLIHL
jgi:hypothetical protein